MIALRGYALVLLGIALAWGQPGLSPEGFSAATGTAQTATTTTLSASPNPAVVGNQVILTATVTGAGATGTVNFFDGGNLVGNPSLSHGTASLTTSALLPGTRTLTATYSGDTTHLGSTSTPFIETVNWVSTSTTLSLSSSSANTGQTVTLTATVTAAAGTAGNPTGNVTFYDSQLPLGTSNLSTGIAVFPISTLPAGTHSLSARYGGDSINGASSSSTLTLTVIQVAATTTALTVSPNPVVFGQQVALTATVLPSGATGTVTFSDGTASLGSVKLTTGTASFSTSSLTGGTHSLIATYSGDSKYGTSASSAIALIVNQLTLAVSPNPSNFNQPVTLTATMVPSGTAAAVSFRDGGNQIGAGTLSNGTAGFSTSALSVGSHSLTATVGAYTSNSVSDVVNKGTSTTSLAANPSSATPGKTVTLTATVMPSVSTGTVTFLDGQTSLANAALSNGTATFSTVSLAAGSHSLSATYGGDTNFSGSTSGTASVSVSQGNTSTSLSASPNPASAGQQVSLAAVVNPSSATGSVVFKDGATTLGTVTLNAGTANLSVPTLIAGSHSLTASYSGDGTNTASVSPAITEVVNQAGAGVTLTASPNPAAFGQAVIFTATVSPPSATGTVKVIDAATSASVGSTATLVNGVATVTTSTLAVGTHSLQASYSGDTSNPASQSNSVSEVVTPATTATATTTTLGVSPAASTQGRAVTLTATVAPTAATGSVTFMDGSTTLGTATLSGGTATLSTSSLSTGSHTLTATYPGNATFGASTSNPVTENVSTGSGTACATFPVGFVPFSSAAGLSKPDSAGDQAVVGSMSAANFATYQSLPLPAGLNQQYCGTVLLATGVSAVAYVPTAAERTGNFSLFAGLLTDPASGQPFPNGVIPASRIPGTLAWRVVGAFQNSTTNLSVTPLASTLHQAVTLTALVTPASATGPVTFLDGSATLGTATLVAGTATLTVATLTAGTHSITASYGGDSNNGPSSSPAVTATVVPSQTTVTHTVLTSSASTATFGQTVTLTATVTPSSATGTVTFVDGSATLGATVLSGGSATFKTSVLAVGNHSLAATYAGDGGDTPSVSALVALTVTAVTPVQVASPTALPAALVGTPYTQTYTVTGGVAPFTWSLVSGTQELTMTASGNNGILSGTPKTVGTFTLTVRVQDSTGQSNTATLTWVVNPAVPPVSITVKQPATTSDQPVPSVSVGLAYPVALNATFRLLFASSAAGLPASFTNSAVQFVSGGTTSTVAIPANSTAPVALPAVQLGTVAGSITVTLSSLAVAGTGQSVPVPTPAPSQTIAVPPLAPVIVPGSVKITNITASGFQVVLAASSTPRDLSSANLVFTAASGTQLTGTSTFTVSLAAAAGLWFDPANATAVASGGAFTLTIPFTYSGDISALGSVSATLTNSVGTSAAVSGGT